MLPLFYLSFKYCYWTVSVHLVARFIVGHHLNSVYHILLQHHAYTWARYSHTYDLDECKCSVFLNNLKFARLIIIDALLFLDTKHGNFSCEDIEATNY